MTKSHDDNFCKLSKNRRECYPSIKLKYKIMVANSPKIPAAVKPLTRSSYLDWQPTV